MRLVMAVLTGAVLAGAVAFWYFADGTPAPALALGGGGLAVLLAIFVAWAKFGRERLPPCLCIALGYIDPHCGQVPVGEQRGFALIHGHVIGLQILARRMTMEIAQQVDRLAVNLLFAGGLRI